MTIEFFNDSLGNIIGFKAIGHAGYDVEGRDVVCAAVSVLTQTIVLALQELLHIPMELTCQKGYMACSLPTKDLAPSVLKDAQLLLKTMKLGLENIQEGYKDYIKVITKGA